MPSFRVQSLLGRQLGQLGWLLDQTSFRYNATILFTITLGTVRYLLNNTQKQIPRSLYNTPEYTNLHETTLCSLSLVHNCTVRSQRAI